MSDNSEKHPLEEEHDNSDVLLKAGGKNFYLNSSILSAASSYFKRKLQNEGTGTNILAGTTASSTVKQEIVLEDVKPEIFILALSFYYPQYFRKFTGIEFSFLIFHIV